MALGLAAVMMRLVVVAVAVPLGLMVLEAVAAMVVQDRIALFQGRLLAMRVAVAAVELGVLGQQHMAVVQAKRGLVLERLAQQIQVVVVVVQEQVMVQMADQVS